MKKHIQKKYEEITSCVFQQVRRPECPELYGQGEGTLGRSP